METRKPRVQGVKAYRCSGQGFRVVGCCGCRVWCLPHSRDPAFDGSFGARLAVQAFVLLGFQ